MAGEYDQFLGVRGDAAVATPEPTEGVPASEPAVSGETFSYEGKEYPVTEIASWKQSHEQRGNWQKTLKQEEMRNAQIRQFLSVATGRQIKSFGDLEAADFADLNVMANLNAWLGTHPDQKTPFENHLKEFFQSQGASPAEARVQAKETMAAVKEAGQPGEGVTDDRLSEMQARLDAIEQKNQDAQSAQVSQALETNMEGNLRTLITAGIPDIPEYWKYVRDMVLAELLPYDEEQVVEAARSGELAQFLKDRSEYHIGQVRDMEKRRAQRIADASDPTKKSGTTKPLGSAVPAQVVEDGAVKGAGVNKMTNRLRAGLGLSV